MLSAPPFDRIGRRWSTTWPALQQRGPRPTAPGLGPRLEGRRACSAAIPAGGAGGAWRQGGVRNWTCPGGQCDWRSWDWGPTTAAAAVRPWSVFWAAARWWVLRGAPRRRGELRGSCSTGRETAAGTGGGGGDPSSGGSRARGRRWFCGNAQPPAPIGAATREWLRSRGSIRPHGRWSTIATCIRSVVLLPWLRAADLGVPLRWLSPAVMRQDGRPARPSIPAGQQRQALISPVPPTASA